MTAAAPDDVAGSGERVEYCRTCGKTRFVEWLHRDCPPDPAPTTEAPAKDAPDPELEQMLDEQRREDEADARLQAEMDRAGYDR